MAFVQAAYTVRRACHCAAAVVGCVNPTMQRGMTMTRRGDVITVACDDVIDDVVTVWQMTCVAGRLVGSHGNCSAAAAGNYAAQTQFCYTWRYFSIAQQ